jgi:hypothetical protein
VSNRGEDDDEAPNALPGDELDENRGDEVRIDSIEWGRPDDESRPEERVFMG